MMGDKGIDPRLIGKKGRQSPKPKASSADSLFPVYSRSSTAPPIDYSIPPAWAAKKKWAPGFGKQKKSWVSKTKSAITKAVFIANIVDLEELAQNEEKRLEHNHEELGFFGKLFEEQEHERLKDATDEERRLAVGGHSFEMKSVKTNVGHYEKDDDLSKLKKVTVKKRKLVTEDKYKDAFRAGILAMDGREKGDHMTATAKKFALRLEMKAQKHHDSEMHYGARFLQIKARNCEDRAMRQRQWVSRWTEKTKSPLLPGSPVLKSPAPWATTRLAPLRP
jgi:hypothetical protein